MKHLLTALIIYFGVSATIAQEKKTATSPLYVGVGCFVQKNLYSWYQSPNNASTSGQVFNILPGLGLNIWLGDINHWIASLGSSFEYTPFALGIRHYQGLGALNIPILAKVQFPVAKQQSLWLMLHIGAGVQFQHTNIAARPPAYQDQHNPFFTTIVGEIGIHISAVGYKRQQFRGAEFFIRTGAAPSGAISFNTGLRVHLKNRFNY